MDKFYNKMLTENKLSSVAYNMFVNKEDHTVRKKCDDWERELHCQIGTEEYIRCLKNIYVITNIAKYRSFQYRLLHRAVIMNTHLYQWGMTETNLCTFCNQAKETYTHFFVMCPEVQEMWKKTERLMMTFSQEDITFGIDEIIFNKVNRKYKKCKKSDMPNVKTVFV